ncbi:MAG: hypothetical protein Q8R28_17520 [Dehalococcoidia bacterium]|nr:hypothetical protein [Dehalococcoidia bacterium]
MKKKKKEYHCEIHVNEKVLDFEVYEGQRRILRCPGVPRYYSLSAVLASMFGKGLPLEAMSAVQTVWMAQVGRPSALPRGDKGSLVP